MLIHVTCPSCSEPYDIADTFAGGVYRCTKCNTLMSVPKPLMPPPATRLAPGMGKVVSPDEMERRGSSQPSKASSSVKSASKTTGKATGKATGKTATGKYGKKGPPPSLLGQYKWHLASMGGLLLVAGIVYTVVKANSKVTEINQVPEGPKKRPVSPYVFTYAKGVLTNDKPNVLGLPLSGNVAVIIDGSSDLDGVRPALHKLLAAGLIGKPYDKPMASFVYATGDDANKLPSLKAFAGNALDAGKTLADFFGKIKLTNPKRMDTVDALKPAIQTAITQIVPNQTRHIVLIIGRNLTAYSQNQLVSALEKTSQYSTQIDLVAIDGNIGDMGDLTDLVSKTRGLSTAVSATAVQNAANSVK